MARVIRWQPEVNIISFDTSTYPGVRDIHWHKGYGGNIHLKMVFVDGNYVDGDVDEQTPIAELENMLDWMYRKGEQNGFVQ